MAKYLRVGTIALALMLLLTACAPGANPAVDVPAQDGDVAGFFMGLWHGLIVPITFVVSLFTESVSVYEVHNSGGWYDFGFVFGASMSLGGGGAGAHRASR
ncbi:MAG TPA: hypothetical protein VLG28_11315 [Acidimicrobiia bacterium]|jgi:hypothetical protein|nr:hypothetical protein [Acidimicrobiia bacterium]